MAAKVIDGKAVAARIRGEVSERAEMLRGELGRKPGLATILVGDDPASSIYVARKHEACEEVGIASFHHEPGGDVSQEDLAELIGRLNSDSEVDGILLQLPLPAHLETEPLIAAIAPGKDVDGLTPYSAGLLATGAPGLVPCTPRGVMELLRSEGIEPRGKRAVVVGRSTLVGRPVAALLLAADATVTMAHSRTVDLASICREAEILIAAAGRPRLIDAGMVSQGATVIDVGTNRTDDGLVGDVDFDGVREVAGLITPVPGGVGPMTIAMLLSNTVDAASATVQA